MFSVFDRTNVFHYFLVSPLLLVQITILFIVCDNFSICHAKLQDQFHVDEEQTVSKTLSIKLL